MPSEPVPAVPQAVTHVSPFGDYPGQAVFSGAENHLFMLMAGQRAAGLDVELLMLVVQDGPRLVERARELEAHGIAVTRLVYARAFAPVIGRGAWVAQLPRLVRLMRARRQRIIHTHQPHASQLGRLAAYVARARAIVDSVHNDEPFFARSSWRARLKWLDRRTGATIAISQRVKRHLVDAVGLDGGRIEVIPYGLDMPKPTPRAEARAALGLPADAFVVGFVGRLMPQKDLPTLLAAMTLIPDVHLAIVGVGEEEAALRARVAELGLVNVHFCGLKPRAADLMTAFDVFALPSKWEGLGLVLLEAMAQGVPIAASRGGAIPEVLREGELGLLSDVGDATALAANVVRLRDDPGLRERLIAAGRAAVATDHSVAVMVARTSAVYRRALTGTGEER